MKKVQIPVCDSPFIVYVNGVKYIYPSGTEQEVPDDVADVIEQHDEYHKEKDRIDKEGDGSQGGGSGGGAVGKCKLRVTVDNDGDVMPYGKTVLFDDKTTTIHFENMVIGETVEYEIPCGSAIVKSCDFGATVSNLTEIPVGGDGTVVVYAAPNEPNAVATMRVYFGW